MIVRVGGDIITEVDRVKVRTFEELSDFIDAKQPGDTVTLTLNRQGRPSAVEVRLRERPRG
jgi:S1-C subfamily serine protease